MVAEEWTGALIARLASEFQGFCRDLHDEAVDSIVHAVAMCSPRFTTVLIKGLIFGRGLNRRSADPATVHADFTRLGLVLNLGSVRRWRNLVNEIAVAIETTVNQDLADRFVITPREMEV